MTDPRTVDIQITASQGGRPLGGADVSDRLAVAVQRVAATIADGASIIRQAVAAMETKPSEISLEFSVAVSAEGSLFFAKSTLEGALKVTVAWKHAQ